MKRLSSALSRLPIIGRASAACAELVHARLVLRRNRLQSDGCDMSLVAQWRRVFDADASVAQKNPARPFRPGGILLFPIWGPVTATSTKAVELILAHALHLRGHSVALMACQRTLPACVVDPLGNHRGKLTRSIRETFGHGAGSCVHCVAGINNLSRHSLVPFLSMSEHYHRSDLVEAEAEVNGTDPRNYRSHNHAGVHVGEHAFASAIRATGRGTLEDSDLHREIFRRQLIAAIVCARVTHRALDVLRPSQIGLTHGIYVDHGTVTEVARIRGIPVTVYARPYRQSTVLLCRGDTYHRALINEPNALWENRVLSAAERSKLLEYLHSRRRGERDSVTYHPDPIEGQERIRAILGLDHDKPTVTAYTNVMWDAQLYHASSAFQDMLGWLFATIDFFIAHPGQQLVIRVHPAEVKAVKKSLQPVAREIANRYGALPSNIKVIPPESNISSYDLAEVSSANLIYGTKMGLEMALMRRPVIVAGESFVRGKGFTHDASSPSDYLQMLDAAERLPAMDDAAYERALRYGYHFYYRRQIDLPFFSEEKGQVRLSFADLGELLPSRNANLDAICSAFATGEEFLAP